LVGHSVPERDSRGASICDLLRARGCTGARRAPDPPPRLGGESDPDRFDPDASHGGRAAVNAKGAKATEEATGRSDTPAALIPLLFTVVAVVAFLVYLGALWNEFVWDDPIVLNQQLQAFHSL